MNYCSTRHTTDATYTQSSSSQTANSTYDDQDISDINSNYFSQHRQFGALCFYSVCYSIITHCGYWNDLTLDALSEHGNLFYKETLNDGNKFQYVINYQAQ